MWTCSACGRAFANRNQTHTCAPLGNLDDHFAGKDSLVRATFDRVLEIVGPVTVLPEKTRIALQIRMSFAAFTPRVRWLDGHVILGRRAEHPLIRKVEVYSPRNILHAFRLTSPADIDDAFAALLTEGAAVGLGVRAERSGEVLPHQDRRPEA